MSELSDFYPQILLVVVALLVAIAASPLAHRVGLPAPGAFLALGIVLGLVRPDVVDLPSLLVEQIGVVALFVVLFHGGIATGAAAFRRSARPILLLGLPGTAATAGALTLIGLALGLEPELALFVGIALAPTDPAAVYAALRHGGPDTRARSVLEGESGFNDPVGITLMVVAVAAVADGGGASVGGTGGRLLSELAIGTAVGVAAGLALRAALPVLLRLEDELRPLALLGAAFAVGAGTAALHGSGFLAVYLCGLVVSDRWGRLDPTQDAVIPALSAAAEPVIFALLGAAFVPLVELRDVLVGIVLALALAFVVRPAVAAACLVGSRLRPAERVLVSWGGLKGAVPLILAAYPALEALEGADRAKAIVLVATASSILVQGATLQRVARRV